MPKLVSSSSRTPRLRRTARGMLCRDTPVEHYPEYGLYVKREDLSCPSPGPAFSKTRGVYAHIFNREEDVIGVLDTVHSQGGHAVARACQILKKRCLNFYPEYKATPGLIRPAQKRAAALGAELVPLQAGRSCILYHQAKKLVEAEGGYMMPNALKLSETVYETAKEYPVEIPVFDAVIVPVSSATIAAGVIRGIFADTRELPMPKIYLHLGYSRSAAQVRKYICEKLGCSADRLTNVSIVDEGYSYKDEARPGSSPSWPCNKYYDLKAFRWWLTMRHTLKHKRVLFWNVG